MAAAAPASRSTPVPPSADACLSTTAWASCSARPAGGTGKDTGKRHPTLGNNVLIGAGTKVLGPVYIGDNSRIGAGSVVLRNLPANCTAVGVPAEVVRINNKAVNPADDLDQQDLPDIVAQRLTDLDRRLGALENAAQGDTPPTAAQIAARQKS